MIKRTTTFIATIAEPYLRSSTTSRHATSWSVKICFALPPKFSAQHNATVTGTMICKKQDI